MSAIWGCVDLAGPGLAVTLGQGMRGPVEKYAIDRFEEKSIAHATMGCGIQYFDTIAKREALPLYDTGRELLFTADAILDNRARLAAELAPERPDIPDGELLYRAWLKWGAACHDHLYGSYAFAVYSAKDNLLTLATDYMATRCLYWTRQGNRVAFGTSLDSVVAGMSPPPELNHDWAADYLSLPFILSGLDAESTPYKGVYRMAPATWRTFAPGKEDTGIHWDPRRLPPLELEDDEAYRCCFLDLMGEVAEDFAARDSRLGVLLSGGMDSAATAAVTARALARRGEVLHTYTSVPIAAYPARRNRHITEDESREVRQLCGMYPNMKPRFCALEEEDALTHADEDLTFRELPSKTVSNNTWMYGICEQARREGCRIMLNGQMGNATLSYGNRYQELFETIAARRPVKAVRLLNHIGRTLGESRKEILRYLLENSDFSREPRLVPPTEAEVLESAYVNPRYARYRGSLVRIRADRFHQQGKHFRRSQNRMENLLAPLPLVHVGEAYTKLGLAKGLVIRDFCAERRIVEFCCRIPETCFVQNGMDRRLVRVYMRALLPESITTPHISRRGVQSADWVARLQRRWPLVEAQLTEAFEWLGARGFVDIEKFWMDFKPFPENYGYEEDLFKLIPMFGALQLKAFLESRFPTCQAGHGG